MITRLLRKIVKIDEEKCNGCGLCVPACVEGALQIVNGKAKLISETYCDGLGACLGDCPQGAITIEEREAKEFDEEATKLHLGQNKQATEELPCGCPSTMVTQLDRQEIAQTDINTESYPSMLSNWPVQLTLVPPRAPFLQGTDLLLAADCVPFAFAGFHNELLRDHSLLVACPKLDDFQAHLSKLTEVIRQSSIKSLTVVHMEVPCCSGLVYLVKTALEQSGKSIPLKEVTISTGGEILATSPS